MAEQDKIRVFISEVSSNMETKIHQQKIMMVLDGKKIPYECIDIASCEERKKEMRDKSGNDEAIPP